MSLVEPIAAWEYQTATNVFPSNPDSEVVPSIGWTSGFSPFGTVGDSILEIPIETAWDTTDALWIRRNFVAEDGKPILISGKLEHAAFIYLDGVYVGSFNGSDESYSVAQNFSLVIPADLVGEGTHQIAALCISDESDSTYVYLTVDYSPAILAVQPAAPVRERLSFLTEIHDMIDGKETRVSLSSRMTQILEFDFPSKYKETPRAMNIVYGALGLEWFVPLWTQPSFIGSISAGTQELTFSNVEFHDYFRGSFAFIWQSTDKWQIVGVDHVLSTTVKFSTLIDEFSNAIIMPMRVAVIPNSVTRKYNGLDSEFSITFHVKELIEYLSQTPDTFLGEDLYTENTLLDSNNSSDDISTNMMIFDTGLGPISHYASWLYSKNARNRNVILETHEEIHEFRKFVVRRMGRYRSFWEPSFERDFRIKNSSTITTTIDIEQDELLQFPSDRSYIALQEGSNWHILLVTDKALISSSTIRLTLDDTISLDPSLIDRACWLSYKRLNSDEVQIDYVGAGIARSSVRTIEVQYDPV